MFASLVKLAALAAALIYHPAPVDAPGVLGANDIGPYLPPVTVETLVVDYAPGSDDTAAVDTRVLDCLPGPFGSAVMLTALSLPAGVADGLIADGVCGIRGVRIDGSSS